MRALKSHIDTTARPGVKRKHTEKLYWQRYAYLIEFDAGKHAKRTLPASQSMRRLTIHTEVLEALNPVGDATSRRNNDRACLYFTDETDAIRAATLVGDSLTAVGMPRTAQDLNLLLVGDDTCVKTVIRTNLFWAKYTYAVTFNDIDTSGDIKRIESWLKQFNETADGEDRVNFQYSDVRRAYFIDEDDLFFFKLVFHSSIARIEKAILTKDISSASEFDQGAC